ncbi:unnamed protein product [Linum tenue]|uniref:NAC domain-containing protein n=1 Tax=Linum tenue TaxID=586396 RepID=A0AAV0JF52_9ROSI|nr:unnamed protein product [Linum tenue]
MDPQLLLDCFPHTTTITHRYTAAAAADNNNYNPNYTTTTTTAAASQQLLPPGFRFHPTDEELITYYLLKKVMDSTFSGRAIAEVDLNKCEPWHLPEKAKMGEKEWYFFSLRDRKYPTGLRTNRATEAGYWKATGKDREIYSTKTSALVGMKKTLVFYRGRAPKGEKSNWVMHEYRLDGKFAYHYLSRSSKVDEWVISRVFQKSGVGAGGNGCTASNNNSAAASSAKKPRSSAAAMSSGSSAYQEVSSPPSAVSHLPALLDPTTADSYSYGGGRHHQQQHVSCFSTGTNSTTTTVAAAAASDHHHHQQMMTTMFNNNGLMMAPDHHHHHHYQRNVLSSTTSAFPSLRSLQENLNLPLPHHLFFPPPATSAAAVVPPPSFGGGGMMSWMEEGKVATASELDCMWTY